MDDRWQDPKCLVGSNGDSGLGVGDESEELFCYYNQSPVLQIELSNPYSAFQAWIYRNAISPMKLTLLFEKGY